MSLLMLARLLVNVTGNLGADKRRLMRQFSLCSLGCASGSKKASDVDTGCQNKLTKEHPQLMLICPSLFVT